MDKYTLKHMSEEQYKDLFKNIIKDNVYFLTNISKGHSKEIHVEQNDMDLLSRMLKDNVNTCSCFTNLETMKTKLCGVLGCEANIERIYNWVQSDKIDFNDPEKYKTLAFSTLTKSTVGYGFINTDEPFKKMETSAVRVVLERDFSDDSVLGFHLKTAYPDIEINKRNLQNAVKETDISYTFDDIQKKLETIFTPLERLSQKARMYGLNACLQSDNNGYQQLKVKVSIAKNAMVIGYYDENKVNFKYMDLDTKKRIDSSQLFMMNNPKCKKMIDLIRDLHRFQGKEKNETLRKVIDAR